MGKILHLSFSNIRKNKGQAVSFFVITMISSLLFYIGVQSSLGYPRDFDRKAEQLCAPDLIFVSQSWDSEVLADFERELLADEQTERIEINSVLIASGIFSYAGGEQSRGVMLCDVEKYPELDRWTILEESLEPEGHPIYLPWLMKKGGGYKLGDSFELRLQIAGKAEQKLYFTVAGFYEDIYFSTIYSTTTGFLVSSEEYARISSLFEGEIDGLKYNVQLNNKDEAESYTTKYGTALSRRLPQGCFADSNHYETLKVSRTVTSSIAALILLCFSIIVIAILLAVVKFRIGNSIEEDMQSIGALKAIGFTSRQIICAFLLQFVLLSTAGVSAGILLSYPLLPLLSEMFAMQTGIVWNQRLSITALLLTFLSVTVSVALVVLVSANRVRKLHPIIALRFGVRTHNFRRNRCPLEKIRGTQIFSLAGKQLCYNASQNLMIGIIVAGITFAMIFAGVLYYNIRVEEDYFLNMVSGQRYEAELSAKTAEDAALLLREAETAEQVESAFYCNTTMVTCEEDWQAYAYITEGQAPDPGDWNYKGRLPSYENEVSIGGLLAKELGKKVGDTIRIAAGDVEQEYLITGLIQGSNFLGRDLCMTGDGYKRLVKEFRFTMVAVKLQEGEDTAAFLTEFEKYSNALDKAVNSEERLRGSMKVYQSVVEVLVIVVDALTMIIIGLILYLVIKTMLIRRKRELAIQKAIGFTTIQLAFVNALALLPVLLLGTVIGCGASLLGLNPFISILFSGIGIIKVNFVIPAVWLFGTFLAVNVIGFAISLLICARIRKVAPYTLMSE